MLSHLKIKNYALIRDLKIDFGQGFSVITGETGAGKSILLGALNLILGKRADTNVLLDINKKCIVEGSFNSTGYKLEAFFSNHDLDYDGNLILLRREINSNGKSRAFINDTPVNLITLKELGASLINIHSQHETLNLNDSSFQIAIVDSYAGINEKVRNFGIQHSGLVKLNADLVKILEAEEKSRKEQDYWQFLFDELENANLDILVQEKLESELKILNNAEEIKSELHESSLLLNQEENGLLNVLSTIKNNLNKISDYCDDLKDLQKRVEAGYIEFKDIANELEKAADDTSINPNRVEELTARLDGLYHLQQKHRVNSVDELIRIRLEYQQKLNDIAFADEKKNELEKNITEKTEALKKEAEEISKKRSAVFSKIEGKVIHLLGQLGMPHASFQIKHLILPTLSSNGIDKINFLFNANKGGILNEISKVASGGELSRLMLSIKSLISQKDLLPTIIFDEIDMGISGNIADMAGNILKKLASNMQVIAITHLPQIAGKGDFHYKVYKSNINEISETIIQHLSDEDRTIEIAKMLSGQNITAASVETAKQLLNG
jgi:DNA repair protein RecN (Recombination protein N)